MRINEQIRVPQVRLIKDEEQLGVVPTLDALRMAEAANLDLVEIAPTASPPVCKIMDYGKFKYEQSKRERDSRRGSKQVELREVRMRVKIDTHDRDFKIRTARKLLAEGDKVRVSVMFRAREITHPEVAQELLTGFYDQLKDIADLERSPMIEGRFMSMTLDPSKKAAAATQVKAREASRAAATAATAPAAAAAE